MNPHEITAPGETVYTTIFGDAEEIFNMGGDAFKVMFVKVGSIICAECVNLFALTPTGFEGNTVTVLVEQNTGVAVPSAAASAIELGTPFTLYIGAGPRRAYTTLNVHLTSTVCK